LAGIGLSTGRYVYRYELHAGRLPVRIDSPDRLDERQVVGEMEASAGRHREVEDVGPDAVVALPADERRRAIVARAAELFNSRGYYQTTMDDIATAVGIRKSTMYHYFSSKHEILFWIHEEVIDEIIARGEARDSTDMSAGDGLLEIIADILEIIETRPGYSRVFFEHSGELPPEEQSVVHEKRRRYTQLMEGVIRRGVETGEFRALDPEVATLAVGGMCNWAYQWLRPERSLSSREIAAVFRDIIVNGLSASQADPSNQERHG
jgi:TetR/AcrR family transcriptional regulator, cholesterol catabolism regulator